MPISLVTGGALNSSAANGGNVTLTLPAGIAENDVVYVCAGRVSGPSMTTANYTQVATVTSNTHIVRVFRKVMGATPDTTAVVSGSGNTADAMAAVAFVLRGVDTTTPEDATATTASGSSSNPNGPLIVTVTANAWVISFASSRVNDTAITAPSGYSNTAQASANDNNASSAGGATTQVASAGTQDPAAWSGWSSGTWGAITVAVRPAALRILSLAGETAAFTCAGQAAGLVLQRLVVGAAGAYSVAGQDAGLSSARLLAGEAGGYALTGQDAGLTVARAVTGEAAGYIFAGKAAALVSARILKAGAGAYAVAGIAAEIAAARLIGLDAGSYALDGQASVLDRTRSLLAEAAGYLAIGRSASLETTAQPPQPEELPKRAPGQPMLVRRLRAVFNGRVIEFDSIAALQRAVADFERAAQEDAKALAAEIAEQQPKRRAKKIAERVAPQVSLLKADGPDEALVAELKESNARMKAAYEAELRAQLLLLNARIAAEQADEDDAVMALEW